MLENNFITLIILYLEYHSLKNNNLIKNKYVKVVPIDIDKNLTAVWLAYWIMDDSSFFRAKNQVIICTYSYSKEEVLRLISILNTKFNLSTGLITIPKNNESTASVSNVNYNNCYYHIRINSSSLPTLIKLTKPYFIPSMYYKLGL